MSVSAHELERAALLKKDRDQLQAIATAMGRKPPARARKADMIDLIMELAGMPAPGSADDAEPAAAPEEATPAPTADTEPDASSGTDTDSGSDADSDSEADPVETPAAEAAPAVDADPAVTEPAEDRQQKAPAGSRGARSAEARDEPRPSAQRGARQREDAARAPRAPGQARFVFSPEDPGPDAAPTAAPDPSLRGADDEARPSPRDTAARRRPAAGDRSGDRAPSQESNDSSGSDVARAVDAPNASNDGRTDDDNRDEDEAGGRRRRRRGKNRDRPEDRPLDEQSLADAVEVSGYLDLRDEGYGFLRVKGYLPTREDVYVPSKFIRQTGLRKGDHLTGASRPAGRGEKNPALLRIDSINGQEPESTRERARFDDLTPVYPDSKLHLELADDPENLTARVIDLSAPIGKGQRGLIVAPPKTGKTTLLKLIAHSMQQNHPEVELIVLLVDERPEEVTDMERFVGGDVVASTFDRPADEHTQIAEMTVERAKRMVELGSDVLVILDGMGRLARAYGQTMSSGRAVSGGLDATAIHPAKRLFGAARNIEGGGSLTILATCETGTGSTLDDAILEEFAGTENMELRLDRSLADRRMFPAIDVRASSTRQEELLFDETELVNVWALRTLLGGANGAADPVAALAELTARLEKSPTNAALLAEVGKGR